MATQTVTVEIQPRAAFRPFLESEKRWAVLVAHRRAGKTVAVVQKLIKCALTHHRKGPPLRYGYIAPTRDQAKDIAWAYLKDYAQKIPGSVVNESELKVTLPNKAAIRLYSGENYERMRGLYFDGVVSDEDADIPPQAFDFVILPCLLDYDGWHTRIGTPKGRNVFYKAYRAACEDPNSFALMLRASESGILSESALSAMREKLTPDAYAQEMECDFNIGRPGAIYARLIEKARDEGRIGKFPVADSLVYTSWDLGSPQNTTVWYWQIVNAEIRVLDCDVGVQFHNGEEVKTAVQRVAWMKAKNYNYGTHFLPHDAKQTERTGTTFETELRKAGFSSVRVLPVTHDIWSGIRQLQGHFPALAFRAPQCEAGLEALENYHTKEVDPGKRIQNEPVHDWSSHVCDALRYMAEAIHHKYVKVGATVYGRGDLDPWGEPRRRKNRVIADFRG